VVRSRHCPKIYLERLKRTRRISVDKNIYPELYRYINLLGEMKRQLQFCDT
jgi:hypothetical protein